MKATYSDLICLQFWCIFLESCICNNLARIYAIQNSVVQDFLLCIFFFVAINDTCVKIGKSILINIIHDSIFDIPIAIQVLFVYKSKIEF